MDLETFRKRKDEPMREMRLQDYVERERAAFDAIRDFNAGLGYIHVHYIFEFNTVYHRLFFRWLVETEWDAYEEITNGIKPFVLHGQQASDDEEVHCLVLVRKGATTDEIKKSLNI